MEQKKLVKQLIKASNEISKNRKGNATPMLGISFPQKREEMSM